MLQASLDELRRENGRLRGLLSAGGASGGERGAEGAIGSSDITAAAATGTGIGDGYELSIAVSEKSPRLLPTGDRHSELNGPSVGTGAESPEPTLLQSFKVCLPLFSHGARL